MSWQVLKHCSEFGKAAADVKGRVTIRMPGFFWHHVSCARAPWVSAGPPRQYLAPSARSSFQTSLLQRHFHSLRFWLLPSGVGLWGCSCDSELSIPLERIVIVVALMNRWFVFEVVMPCWISRHTWTSVSKLFIERTFFSSPSRTGTQPVLLFRFYVQRCRSSEQSSQSKKNVKQVLIKNVCKY